MLTMLLEYLAHRLAQRSLVHQSMLCARIARTALANLWPHTSLMLQASRHDAVCIFSNMINEELGAGSGPSEPWTWNLGEKRGTEHVNTVVVDALTRKSV